MGLNKSQGKCPKCKSRFGVFRTANLNPRKEEIICCNGDCDWKTDIASWNKANLKRLIKLHSTKESPVYSVA